MSLMIGILIRMLLYYADYHRHRRHEAGQLPERRINGPLRT